MNYVRYWICGHNAIFFLILIHPHVFSHPGPQIHIWTCPTSILPFHHPCGSVGSIKNKSYQVTTVGSKKFGPEIFQVKKVWVQSEIQISFGQVMSSHQWNNDNNSIPSDKDELVMMIIGGFVVIAGASGCLIPSANYEGDSTKWHRHFTPTVVMMTTKMMFLSNYAGDSTKSNY